MLERRSRIGVKIGRVEILSAVQRTIVQGKVQISTVHGMVAGEFL